MAIQRHNVGKRLSEIVVHNGVAYLAGEVRDDTSKDITGQTEEVLGKIERLLKQVGSDKTKLLSAQIFLPDMGDFAGMNKAWEAWVVPGQTPARATIEAKLANPAYKVEIMCIAAIGSPSSSRRPTRRSASARRSPRSTRPRGNARSSTRSSWRTTARRTALRK